MIYGVEMFSWMKDLFPLNRSLSGEGNRETLRYLQDLVPNMSIGEFKSGYPAFDWVIPHEWNVDNAFIERNDGSRLAEFSNCNLHLVGYSIPIDKIVSKEELLKHIHYIDEIPNAIPYVTSYYKNDWGFCITKQEFEKLGEGPFRVYINSSLKGSDEGGVLNYGEVVLKGKSSQEILFSTYICHPSMANNELSGPVLSVALIKEIANINHHYTYRFLFLPETIGAIAYLSENYRRMKKKIIAGWVLTCIGDKGNFSYVPSRQGNNYADRITKEVLRVKFPEYITYSWLDRGSDERQFCSPGIDLPVCAITRSKYDTYSEYHTNLDNLEIISEESLEESLKILSDIVKEIESKRVPKSKILCEPQMGKRDLYPNLSSRQSYSDLNRKMMDVLSYLDGCHTLEDVSNKCGIELMQINEIIEILLAHDIIEI
jgi:aminopeptidase-like protein